MFKTYNVIESLWQMNLFATMQVHRQLSTLSYFAEEMSSAEDEPAEKPAEQAIAEPARHRTAA